MEKPPCPKRESDRKVYSGNIRASEHHGLPSASQNQDTSPFPQDSPVYAIDTVQINGQEKYLIVSASHTLTLRVGWDTLLVELSQGSPGRPSPWDHLLRSLFLPAV